MLCTACSFENPSGIKFCGECGAALKLKCSSCGAENPPGFRFCGDCGRPLAAAEPRPPAPDPRAYTPKHLAEKILTSRAALEGERKQVTVLFADVKGSMDLAEQVDPEDWHQIMDRFFAILADGVHRFEGTINQFTGDGIMALFGAPIAHEDHARRACYTALHLTEELRRYAQELRRDHGLNFTVRMGLNSGEVVVGKIGDNLRMDYTAQGHTVGLAARMEDLAEPGKVYLTEATASLVSGYFRLDDLGGFTVKGVHEPVHVFELQGVGALRTPLERSRARGFSRFVGRADEIAALEAALGRAVAGSGQVVGLVADPGLGKSRLSFEFTERCRARGLTVYEAHGVSHGKLIPFLPVFELFRAFFRITDQDSEQAARDKIAGRMLLLDESLRDALPLLFDFLSVPDPERPLLPMEPEARQRQLYATVKRVMQARSQREPAVVLLEDLHWFDSGSEGVLEVLVDAARATRTVLVVNFRPEYHADWMQKSYYQQLPLLPLEPAAIDELLHDLLGADPSLATLPARIRERTGGNPFFIEETVQALAETGSLVGTRGAYRAIRSAAELALPATVQAVLAARIDRLGEREKLVLQTAAVIGREFTEPVLRRVVELPEIDLAAALQKLTSAEFIYEQALYPQAEYAFKHPLTQEVAYRSQLGERRLRTHAAVARAIAELYPEQFDERAALLAHHWEEAGDALEAARWHHRSARWTEDTDPSESLLRWQKVRDLLAGAVESAETMSLRLEACRGILSIYWRSGGADADAIFAEGKELAERAGDLRSLAILLNLYGNAKGTAGDLRAYHEHASKALRLAERANDPVTLAVLASDAAHAFCWTGRLREALRLAEKGVALGAEDLSLGQELYGSSAYLVGLLWRGLTLVEMGRLEEAASDLDRASDSPREQPGAFVWSQTWNAVRAYRAGDVPGALTHARRALERAEGGGGGPVAQILAQVVLGIALLANAEWSAAEEVERQALALARERGIGFGITAWALRFLAEARLGQGDSRGALELADQALAEARQSGGRLFEMDALLTRARALLGSEGASGAAEVERTLAKASALIDETEARCREPTIHEILAELGHLRGDEATRECELREAHRLFVEMGATGHAERIAPLLAESAR